MTTLTATDARRELFDLVKSVARQHKIYRIHHRSGAAVLLSEEDYESLVETLQLLSIPSFKASIRRSVRQMREGKTTPFHEALGGGA